jgi:hypothetical protein
LARPASVFCALAPGADGEYGKLVVWFDYQLGEKNHTSGLVCDARRGSDRDEKLSQPQITKAVGQVKSKGAFGLKPFGAPGY